MKRRIRNTLLAVCLTSALTAGSLPAAGLTVQAQEDISNTVEAGLTIQESEINQLLTGDLILPDSVEGLSNAVITYSVGNADTSYVSVSGNTLKVTRPYAGNGNYSFQLKATVTADGAVYEKTFPLTIREGLSDNSYAGYVYTCFSDTSESKDVQQLHFFLSEDGLNWTALNGCNPAFLAGSDYTDSIQKVSSTSVNYTVKSGTDISETVSGDASVLFPFEGDDQGVRDPYLIRGCKTVGSDSNKVWLLATDLNTMASKYGGNLASNTVGNWGTMSSAGSTKLFVYETEDWVHWERRYIDVGTEIDAGAAWAPEAIYNPEKNNYLVYWSCRVGTDGNARNRLYCNETSDFVTFGPTKLYEEEAFYAKYGKLISNNSGYGNIDTSQLWVADENGNPFGTLFRLVKDETNNHIQLMSASSVLDPLVDYDNSNPTRITPYTLNGTTYSTLADIASLDDYTKADVVYNWFQRESTGNHFSYISQSSMESKAGAYEGATMFKFIDRDEWCVMIDYYGNMQTRYEPYVTYDLSDPDSITKLTSGYGRTGGDIGCHGGMIPVTVEEYNTLVHTYNSDASVNNYHEMKYIEVDKRALEDVIASLKTASGQSNYSAAVKVQMKSLLSKAQTLDQQTDATTADINFLINRAEKLVANTLLQVPETKAETVYLNKTSVSLGVKETAALTAAVSPDTASQSVTWASSKTSVAVVSSKGVVTAKSAGTATITTKTADGVKVTCKVTVLKAPDKLNVNKTKLSLAKGKSFQIKTTLPSKTACSKFLYQSSKTSVATVSASGKIVAKKKGTAKITVTAANNSKAKTTITVTVK